VADGGHLAGAAVLPGLGCRLPRRSDDDRGAAARAGPAHVPAELVGHRSSGPRLLRGLGRGRRARRTALRRLGTPALDLCQRKPFLEHQQMFNPSFRPGWCYYVRSCDVAAIDDGVIDVVSDFGTRITSPISSIALWQMGGAVARVGEDETAFNGRSAGFTFNINGNAETSDGFEEQRAWARDYWSAPALITPASTSTSHGGGRGTSGRRTRGEVRPLKDLKRKYDPTERLPAQPKHPAILGRSLFIHTLGHLSRPCRASRSRILEAPTSSLSSSTRNPNAE